MIIHVGSRNPIKVEAVKRVFSKYDLFKAGSVKGLEVDSGVKDQPIGFEEIYLGAFNRAIRSFTSKVEYSVGLEGGLIKIPGESYPRLNLAIAAIYDGKRNYIGNSSGFTVPVHVAKIVAEENIELDNAARKCGLTNSKRVGYEEGIIGVFTQGRVKRQDLLEEALRNAVIPLINPELFRLT